MSECKTCGKEVKKSRKYCSRDCFYSACKEKKKNLVTQKCITCGKKFQRFPSQKGLYCSVTCQVEAQKVNKTTTCEVCGKKFTSKHYLTQKCCSYKCSGIYRTKEPNCTCAICGKLFKAPPSREAKFCSQACHGKYLTKNCTEKNARNWKEDRTFYRLIKCPKEFMEMADTRGKVLYHRIQAAKKLGRCLKPEEVVHHIDGDKQNNDLTNLEIFPSNKSHAKWHADLLKKDTNNPARTKVKYVKCPEKWTQMATKRGTIKESRLIVAQELGRCLTRKEVVHHDDEDALNNSVENLALFSSNGDHRKFHTTGKSKPIWSGKNV